MNKEVLMSPKIEENHVWPEGGYPRCFKSLGELQLDKPLKIVIKNFKYRRPARDNTFEEILIKEANAELWIQVDA